MSHSSRYHSLDALRAGMMLLGIVLHAAIAYMQPEHRDPSIWYYYDAGYSAIANSLFYFIHVFRMPIFFVLAGFFTTLLLSRYGVKNTVLKRAKQLIIPLVLGWLLFLPMSFEIASWSNSQNNVDLASLWNNPELLDLLWNKLSYLWFLYFLIIFCGLHAVTFKLLTSLQPSIAPNENLRRCINLLKAALLGKFRFINLAIITTLLTLPMPTPITITDDSFTPAWYILGYYLVFYSFGTALFYQREMLTRFAKYPFRIFGIASGLFSLVGLFIYLQFTHELSFMWQVLGCFTGAISTWLFIESIIGAVYKYCQKERQWLKELSGASYWIYLVHFPIILCLQGVFATLDIHALYKLFAVTIITMMLSYLSYLVLVKNKFIGRILTGRYGSGYNSVSQPLSHYHFESKPAKD